MIRLAFILLTVATSITVSRPASAQGGPEPEQVEDLLERLDDIERRRQEGPEARAVASVERADSIESENAPEGLALAAWALGVATVIFVAAFVIRRVRPKEPDADDDGALEIRESMWLGRGLRVFLIRVRDQEILVGASGGQLSSLGAVARPTSPRSLVKTDHREGDREVGSRPSNRAEAERFAHLVQEELTTASGGAPSRKRQILARLNSL